MTCKVCDVEIKSSARGTEKQIHDYIEKHLESDEHWQKSKVFMYLNFYAKVKGFDIEKHSNIDDFKSFLTVLQVVTLHSSIAVMNMNYYNHLYKHVDHLVTARIPNVVCFASNFLEYVTWILRN